MSLPAFSPGAAEDASQSSAESSAQSEAVPCAFRGARLQKPFIPSISSEFQAAVKESFEPNVSLLLR